MAVADMFWGDRYAAGGGRWSAGLKGAEPWLEPLAPSARRALERGSTILGCSAQCRSGRAGLDAPCSRRKSSTCDAVDANNGEVLTFIGDAMLAIVPIGGDTASLCSNGLAAARMAREAIADELLLNALLGFPFVASPGDGSCAAIQQFFWLRVASRSPRPRPAPNQISLASDRTSHPRN